MEELLYYPQCDCEDRAVFYAYLLRYVLNLDCHLVKYPVMSVSRLDWLARLKEVAIYIKEHIIQYQILLMSVQ